MKEDYCDYNLSKNLKDCGFDEPCEYFYSIDKAFEEGTLMRGVFGAKNFNNTTRGVSAVPLWQAQKWMREKWSLHISVNPLIPSLYWEFFIDDLNQYINPQDGELMSRWTEEMQEEESNRPGYDSYESALSAGLTAALELLGKEVEK